MLKKYSKSQNSAEKVLKVLVCFETIPCIHIGGFDASSLHVLPFVDQNVPFRAIEALSGALRDAPAFIIIVIGSITSSSSVLLLSD